MVKWIGYFFGLLPLVTVQAEAGGRPACEDKLVAHVIVDRALRSDLFTTHVSSYPWYVVVDEKTGKWENTFGGAVSKQDRVKIEHTSNCDSTHQGTHRMNFCEATIAKGKLVLFIHGGLPAYSSDLTITVDGGDFTCSFGAEYPSSFRPTGWRITRKEMKTRGPATVGSRYFAWISVEFEEAGIEDGKVVSRPYKIEGFLKPWISE